MEHKDPIENWLRESFEQDAQGNPDALWEKIAPSLPTKSKKRVLVWWWGAALFTLATGTLLLLTSEKKGIPTQANSETSQPSEVNTKPKSPSTAKEEIDNNTTINSAQNNSATAKITKPEQYIQESVVAENERIHKKLGEAQQNIKDITPKAEEIIGKQSNSKKSLPENTEPFNLNISTAPRSLNLIPTSILSYNLKNQLIDLLEEDKSPKTGTENDNNLTNPWTIGASAGINPSRVVSAVENGFSQFIHKDYSRLRNEGEQALFTGGFEVYIRKNIGRLFIETGYRQYSLGYEQNYNYLITDIPITQSFGGIVPDANGRYPLDDQTPYLADPTPEQIDYQGTIRQNFNEIPFRIGFTLGNKKLRVSPMIGGAINFGNPVGSEQTIDYQTLQLISFNELFAKQENTNYSAMIGMNVETPLYKNLYFQAQPYYHQMLNSPTSVVRTQQFSYGIQIGLNLKIAAK